MTNEIKPKLIWLAQFLKKHNIIRILFIISILLVMLLFVNQRLIPFSINPKNIDENISIDSPTNFTLAIKDLSFPLSSDQNLTINVEGIEAKWLRANGKEIGKFWTILKPQKIQYIHLNVTVLNDTIPGKYDGDIILNSTYDFLTFSCTSRYVIKTSLRVVEPASNALNRAATISLQQDMPVSVETTSDRHRQTIAIDSVSND